MILSNEALQYWHSKLNHLFFDNQLEPAVIKVYDPKQEDEDGLEARFIGEFEPFLIEFYFDVQESEIYTMTILLHEMVHQYCREIGIEDVDEFGRHTDEFRECAEMHGLEQGGYKLSKWAEEAIVKAIELYERIVDASERLNDRRVQK